jgi:hypothetical protein
MWRPGRRWAFSDRKSGNKPRCDLSAEEMRVLDGWMIRSKKTRLLQQVLNTYIVS